MNAFDTSNSVPPTTADNGVSERTIAQLVGDVYADAPADDRCRMLQHLMKPLGALSLVAVANGVFAKLWFRSGWRELDIQPDDVRTVQASDVVSLADYVQQASIEVMDGLAQVLTSSPAMACSALVIVLVSMLARRAQNHGGKRSSDPSLS